MIDAWLYFRSQQQTTKNLANVQAWVLDCWMTLLMFWQYAEEGKI